MSDHDDIQRRLGTVESGTVWQPTKLAPRMGASDPYERIRAELIQIGNRHPRARRELADIEAMVAKLAHAHDDATEAQLLERERRGWDNGYAAGLDKLPGDRQRFPRP